MDDTVVEIPSVHVTHLHGMSTTVSVKAVSYHLVSCFRLYPHSTIGTYLAKLIDLSVTPAHLNT